MRIVGGRAGQNAAIAVKSDAIAIRLSEDPQKSITEWELRINAKTNEGIRRVGTVYTTPAALGKVPSRLVAQACCPGAVEWVINVIGPNSAWPADLSISSCAPPFADAGARAITRPLWVPSGAELHEQLVSLAPVSTPIVVPTTLAEIHGYNASGALRYFQIFDAVGVPANGTVPRESFPIPDGSNFDFEPDEQYRAGVVWAISTTGPTLTLDVAAKFWTRARLEV